jgi:hypothetical protein
MEFEITTTKKYNIDCCNDCPFCHCEEDTSVVFDSFDEPNYDYYCGNENADNKGTGCEEFNDPNRGVYIGTELSGFRKCAIPVWCPFMKK